MQAARPAGAASSAITPPTAPGPHNKGRRAGVSGGAGSRSPPRQINRDDLVDLSPIFAIKPSPLLVQDFPPTMPGPVLTSLRTPSMLLLQYETKLLVLGRVCSKGTAFRGLLPRSPRSQTLQDGGGSDRRGGFVRREGEVLGQVRTSVDAGNDRDHITTPEQTGERHFRFARPVRRRRTVAPRGAPRGAVGEASLAGGR